MKLIKNEWEVQQIPISLARDFVEKWHYAHGASNTAVACYGLFYKGDATTLHGISWWMPPPLGAAKYVDSDHRSVLALSRFCLVEGRPENAGSFLISKSIRSLDSRWKTLLTYADTALNHNGGLYKASNWSYYGISDKQPIFWDSKNKRIVSRKKGPKTYGKQEMIDMGYEYKGRFSKHRFIYPIRKKLRRKGLSNKPIQGRLELIFTEKGNIFDNNKND